MKMEKEPVHVSRLLKILHASRYRCVLSPVNAALEPADQNQTNEADGKPEPPRPSFGPANLANNQRDVNGKP